MTENFFRTLELRVQEKETLLCIGLDPHVGQLPEPTAEAVCTFCLQIISETSEYAALYKPNAAFFEQFGPPGVYALQRVISAVPSGIPILLDCKRGDIDTTAEAYATSAYKILGADAVTLSPYMGWDSVRPFVTGEHALKGAFVLCKTSNPSANDLQTCETGPDGDVLYEQVVQLCNAWNAKLRAGGEPAADAGAPASSAGDWVGVVAGATDLDALQRIRSLAPDMWILCPGVGAQGGEPEKVCPAGLRGDGSGLLISVSRSISLKAAQGPGAMAAEARRLRDEINALRAIHVASIAGQCLVAAAAECATEIVHTVTDTLTATLESAVNEALPELAQDSGVSTVVPAESMAIGETGTLKDYQKEFLAFAIAQNALQFGSFTLKSGRVSPYFFNAGCFHSGASLATISRCYARAIHESGVQFDVLFGPAYKGIPLATAVAMALYQLGQGREGVEVGYNRKEVKDHGEGGQLVGATVAGRRVLIVDDVITAGTAIREAVQQLLDAGAVIVGVVVCLDRQERVSEESSLSAVQQVELEFGFPVLAVVRLEHLVHYLSAASFSLTAEAPLSDVGPVSAAALLAQASTEQDIEAYRLRYAVNSI